MTNGVDWIKLRLVNIIKPRKDMNMKKITFLMALLVILSCGAAGCEKENENKNDSSSESSLAVSDVNSDISSESPDESSNPQEEETDPYVLIENGEYSKAYSVLYAQKDTKAEYAELLKDFKIVHTEEKISFISSMGIVNHVDEDKITYTYDEQGRRIKSVSDDGEGYVETEEWFYDEQGRHIKTVANDYYDGELDYSYTEEYAYNENGILIYEKWGEDYEIFYDDNGREIKTVIHDYEETLEIVTEYEFDDQGRVLKKIQSDEDTETVTEYTYDDKGNVLSEKLTHTYEDEFEGEDGYCELTEYTYNEKGILIKTAACYLEDGEKSDEFYSAEELTYDNEDRLINKKEILKYGDEEYLSDTEYTYDEYGILVKEALKEEGAISKTVEYIGFEYYYCPVK